MIKSISSVSDKDYIDICSTFITQTNAKYRCHDCIKKHVSGTERLEKHQIAMSCIDEAPSFRHKYSPDLCNKGNPVIKYSKCIGNYYDGFWGGMINYYPKYSDGILPFEGGFLDQPAKFVEVMELVHNLFKEHQEDIEAKKKLSSRNRIGR